MAKNLAEQSSYDSQRHAAILVKGGNIINFSCNRKNFSCFGARFRRIPGQATIHAEIGAILGLPKKLTKNADIYVVRVKGDSFCMSKPCQMCQAVLQFVGVRRVYYTTDCQYLASGKIS